MQESSTLRPKNNDNHYSVSTLVNRWSQDVTYVGSVHVEIQAVLVTCGDTTEHALLGAFEPHVVCH